MISHYLIRTPTGRKAVERHDSVTRNGTAIRAVVDRELCERCRVARELADGDRTAAEVVVAVGTKSWQ